MQLRGGIFFVAFLGATLAAFGNDTDTSGNLTDAPENLTDTPENLIDSSENIIDTPESLIDTSGNLTDTYEELTNSSGNPINISGNYTSGNQTDVDMNQLAAGFSTIMIICGVIPLIYLIVCIVVALVGYKKWDWTVLAAVLVIVFGPFGVCCALAMNKRTQRRSKTGYYAGHARPT
uniref:Transmembrane protein 134 n=1 Tax=Plectus sambesii TaxID=2011161 RepID=A0A914VFK6_9BILA